MDLTITFGQLYLASSTDVRPVSCVERCLHHSVWLYLLSDIPKCVCCCLYSTLVLFRYIGILTTQAEPQMALGEKRKKRLSSPMHQSATASLPPMRQSDFHSTEDEQSWRRHTGKGRCRLGPSWVRCSAPPVPCSMSQSL